MFATKTFTNIIFFILIFQVICVENPKYGRMENFKPFISTPILDNYLEPDENLKPISFADSDYSRVKCIYLSDDYNLYDIRQLGVNSLNSNKEVARTHVLKGNDDLNYTIYFNFCYDLKKSDDCPFDKKQIYYKNSEGQCFAIAGGIGTGNKWTKKTDETNRTNLIIEVNKYESHTFTYILACNDKVDMECIDEKSSLENKNGTLKVTLFVESKHACVEFDFYFIWKFIQDYKVIFIIVLMAFGVFNCLLGKRLVKFTTVSLIVFIITLLVLIFSQYILPSGCAEWIIWVMLAVGLLLGGTAGYFIWKYNDKVIAFVCGGVAGFFVGQFLFSMFGNRIPADGMAMYWVFIVVSIGILIVVAFIFKKAIIIFTTSFIGSYCFIRGISLFAGGFPDETTVIDMRNKEEEEQFSDLLTWKVYVYLASIVILTILSIIAQYKINKDQKDEDEEGAPDTNLKSVEE